MYKIRRATVADIPVLIEMRSRMFESFVDDKETIDEMNRFSKSYFREKIESEEFIAWFAEDRSGEVVACSALSFYYLPPKPFNLDGKYGYISSMYTKEGHRRRGLARQLLQAILEYAKDTGLRCVKLHASEVGEPLYASAGFCKWNEMGLVIDWIE